MPFNAVYQCVDDLETLPSDMVELEDKSIDIDLLDLEGAEADRQYKAMQERASLKQKKERRQKLFDEILRVDNVNDYTDDFDIVQDPTKQSQSTMGEQANAYLEVLKKMSFQEKLDFTNSLLIEFHER